MVTKQFVTLSGSTGLASVMDMDTVPVEDPPPSPPPLPPHPKVTANEIIEMRKIRHLESFIPNSFFCFYATNKLPSFDMGILSQTKGKGKFPKMEMIPRSAPPMPHAE
jgi:hypothetical protein